LISATGAQQACALYKSRWQVELFFKWIKQHLRIKKFFGTSKNAVKTQIWIAISVYVFVAIVKKRLDLDASLYTLLQVLSLTLFEKIPILQALSQVPSDTEDLATGNQLNLFDSWPDTSGLVAKFLKCCFCWYFEWCRLRDSNPRPPDYKSGALPAELRRLTSATRPASLRDVDLRIAATRDRRQRIGTTRIGTHGIETIGRVPRCGSNHDPNRRAGQSSMSQDPLI
jgi:hypothetical protein